MSKELTGRHVLFILLVFFGIIFVVNGIMIYYSQSSWTGLETKDAYRKGVKYNQQLTASRAQHNRGWTMSIVHEEAADGVLRMKAEPRDKDNEPLSQLIVSMELKRPTNEGQDRSIELKETGLGIYIGETIDLPKGKWYIITTAKRHDQVLYRSRNELYLR